MLPLFRLISGINISDGDNENDKGWWKKNSGWQSSQMKQPLWLRNWIQEWRDVRPNWKDGVIYALIPTLLLILFTVLTVYLTRGYDPVKTGSGRNPGSCQGVYESMSDPYPSTTGFCHNFSECWKLASSKTNQDLDWSAFLSNLDFGGLNPVVGAVCDASSGTCCVHGYDACYQLQQSITLDGEFTSDIGVVREFTPWIVQHSPIGFAQNPDTPYFTFPTFAFGTQPYLMNQNQCTAAVSEKNMFDLHTGGLDKNPAGLPLTTLGAMGLMPHQALVISITTPPGYFDPVTGLPSGCKYFSFTPYVGVLGEPFASQFQAGISFSSMGYSYNLYDVQRHLIQSGAVDTSPFSKKLLLIYTYNRAVAERLCQNVTRDGSSSFDLIACLPIPAGSTWDVQDMYGQAILQPGRSNRHLTKKTALVDPTRTLMISPVLRAAGESDELTAWFKSTADNASAFVCGVSATSPDQYQDPTQYFRLGDMNGAFVDGRWIDGSTIEANNPNVVTSHSWKRQLPAFTPEAPFAANLQAGFDALNAQMKAAGYDHVAEVGVFRGTFPKWGLSRTWNQNGFETQNFGIQAQGDCPDTYYPVSENVCVGPNQIAVAIAVNHTMLGNACYNTIAWYDTASVTSIGQTVSNTTPSDDDPNIIISAVSRSDFRCSAPVDMLRGRIQFAATGTHRDVLGSPPTVPLVTMERMYCNPYVLVKVSQLHPGDVVSDVDVARGRPDQPYDESHLGSLDDLDLPPGTVLRRAFDYPEIAAPQSIKTTSALPFRVFVFSRTTDFAPDVCVQMDTCQSATDTTKTASFHCVANANPGQPCPDDGVVATANQMEKKQKEHFVKSLVLLDGNHKQNYITASVVYVALSVMGVIGVAIALIAGLSLSTRNTGELTIPQRWKTTSIVFYTLVGVLAAVDLILAIHRLHVTSNASQFDLYNAYTQAQAKSNLQHDQQDDRSRRLGAFKTPRRDH